jgi:protein TonB
MPSKRKILALASALLAVSAPGIAAASPVGVPHTCQQYYPLTLQQQGIAGTTSLSFLVTSHGQVRDIAVAQSSGNGDLDAAAVACAKRWRYKPATKDGNPIEAPWVAKVVWALPDLPAATGASPGKS